MDTLVRTRFAPSPTGLLHLGNARTALFAYLYAKHHKGQFILRIEDTDQERLTEGSEAGILRDLKWLGLHWDEGPEVGGPVGPYRCSERYDVYNNYLKKLQKVTRVYRCFATPEELDQDRKLQTSQSKVLKYSGRYRGLSDAESQKRADAGEAFVWRLQVDDVFTEPVVIQDEIRGEIKMDPNLMGDFVLFRSNGVPVFLFANAIDDALMEISHVTRGEDHISNTFRQVLIFRALGMKEPVFAHLPMIGDSDGGKFSKRAGSLGIHKLREEGYLASGLVNYLALLGWSPGDTAQTGEKFTKEELISRFELNRVQKGRALFDPNKLNFLNSSHLRDLETSELAKMVEPTNSKWTPIWESALELVKHDADTLNELRKIESYLEDPDYASSEVASDILRSDSSRQLLEKLCSYVASSLQSGASIEDALKENIQKAGKELELKGKALFFPCRVAITGVASGPELLPLAKVLGAEAVQARLKKALEFAGNAA